MSIEPANFENIFSRLQAILKPYEPQLILITDRPGEYYLETRHVMKNKQPVFFGSVKSQKNYVSFYLMPVYAFPDLLADLSPELKKRMQGKSCFNFRSTDPALFAQLAALTEKGFQRYKQEGLLE